MKRFNVTPKLSLFWSIFLCVLIASCTSAPKAKSPHRQAENSDGAITETPIVDGEVQREEIKEPNATETYGPEAPVGYTGENPPSNPEVSPPVAKELHLCLILGPGMARGIAHAGVMERFSKAKIPIHCVVGTEMGAVVGALFASSGGNINQVLWQLFKIKKEHYLDFPLLSMREPKAHGEKFHKLLKDIFADKKIETFTPRFATVAADKSNGTIQNFINGDISDALSATTAIPDIFDEWTLSSNAMVSGANFVPVPADLARELGGNFLVFVDVLGTPAAKSAKTDTGQDRYQRAFVYARNLIKLQRKEADMNITVDVGSLGYEDFSKQGDFLAAGRKAADLALPELLLKIDAFLKSESKK